MKTKRIKFSVVVAFILIGIFASTSLVFAGEALKVNVNSATKEELMTLSGVGEKVAARIIDHRDKFGPFETADDMMKVNGVGPKTLEKNKDRIVVKMPEISMKKK